MDLYRLLLREVSHHAYHFYLKIQELVVELVMVVFPHIVVNITGNPLGPALETVVKNPEDLIKMPKGCGEQTMAKLAPTLYAYQYLKTTGQIGDIAEETATVKRQSIHTRHLNTTLRSVHDAGDQ